MARDTRIYVLMARSAPTAVVFRRGPSKQVLLLRWNLATDTVEAGQWLKGRIYERRCDLSPDGEFLLYFAASYRQPHFSWSAISRPPYLTALALWPKGDGWGGGGHFKARNEIALNHRLPEMVLAEGFRVPKWLHVHPFGPGSGWGEDDPIWSIRLERDGWILVSGGRAGHSLRSETWLDFDPPIIWEKAHPVNPERYTLRMIIRGIKQRNGPWYLIEHDVYSSEDGRYAIGRSDWADWSPNGDLLLAKQGSLFRVRFSSGTLAPIVRADEVIDLAGAKFENRIAPPAVLRWSNK